jgi:TPP-dependent pyruvate/acetoin dehydrogenase alpha subunit
VLHLVGQGLIHGPAHFSIGQEGGAVGSCLSLRSDDQVTGSHRGHHQFLAKAAVQVHPRYTAGTRMVQLASGPRQARGSPSLLMRA